MKLKIHTEICCDECNSAIHTHIDCPICKQNFAETDLYGGVTERDIGYVLKCECGAQYKLITKLDKWDENSYIWEQVA